MPSFRIGLVLVPLCLCAAVRAGETPPVSKSVLRKALRKLAARIDRDRPIDTVPGLACWGPREGGPKLGLRETAVCLGRGKMLLEQYRDVSAVDFGDSGQALVTARSSHDKGGFDLTLMKYAPGKYAYTQAHVCGGILLGSTGEPGPMGILYSRVEGWPWIRIDSADLYRGPR